VRSDRDRLLDMIDAIDAIARHTAGGREALDGELVGAAAMRWVEIIGEAAGRITLELRVDHPQIPWSGMISMRNRLVHGYFEIDADRVWDAVESELPELRDQLEVLLRELPGPPATEKGPGAEFDPR